MRTRCTAGAIVGLIVGTTTGVTDGAAIEVQQMTAADFAFGDFGATGLDTYRLWLTGLATDDRLIAIFGDADSAMTITTSAPGGFFNAEEFGQTHFTDASLYRMQPELQWDTFLVIGPDPIIGDWTVSPDFPDTALPGGGTPMHALEQLAWFDNGPDTPVHPIDGRILVGQFSVAHGASFSGIVSAQIEAESGLIRLERDLAFVPAPGAITFVVLTLARRRRRRHERQACSRRNRVP